MKLFAILCVSLLCVACGNPDNGLIANKKKSSSTSSNNAIGVATSVYVDPASLRFNSCVNMQVYAGVDNSNQYLSGMVACASSTSLNVVKIKASANLPVNLRVCVIASSGTQMSTAPNCQAINGEANFTVDISGFKAVTVVTESNLGAYYAWVNAGGADPYYPSMSYAQVR
jgi:hypothetical protein